MALPDKPWRKASGGEGRGALASREPSGWRDAPGGVSRAAKGADCKSAGYAFVGSSPTSSTTAARSVIADPPSTSAE